MMEFEASLSSESNNSMKECSYNISVNKEDIVQKVSLTFSLLGIVSCFTAIVLLLAGRHYKLLIFRIFLYLMSANMFQGVIQILSLLPVVNDEGHNKLKLDTNWKMACACLGFLDQISDWMGFCCLARLVTYFLYLMITKKLLEKAVFVT